MLLLQNRMTALRVLRYLILLGAIAVRERTLLRMGR
jgi:hypothetical protein